MEVLLAGAVVNGVAEIFEKMRPPLNTLQSRGGYPGVWFENIS